MQLAACLFQSLILVLSLSTDAFAASVAYGAGGIEIPPGSVVVVSVVCSAMLGVSMAVGDTVSAFVPDRVTHALCFLLLLSIGIARLFENMLKGYIRKHKRIRLHLCAKDLNVILTIYADAENADLDHSKQLSMREATALAIALSFDGLAVGFGAAVSGAGVWLPTLVSLLLTAMAVPAGCALGRRMQRSLRLDLSAVSSGLLVVLAFLRL